MPNDEIDRQRAGRNFLNQFEPDGDSYLYRAAMAGKPIRVTAGEREQFLRAYLRANRCIIGLSLLTFLLLASWIGIRNHRLDDGGIFLTTIIVGTLFLPLHGWFWRAPKRELDRQCRTSEIRDEP